jgi:hypothetical protein
MKTLVFVLLSGLASAATAQQPASVAAICAATAARPADDKRLAGAIAEARAQHAFFGGQTIERNGMLSHVGFHEAEFDHRKDDAVPAWQRVAGFWNSVEAGSPRNFKTLPDQSPIRRRELLASIAGLSPTQLRAADSAFLRTALVDYPWSAVFISFLMKSGGFSEGEFAFSESHVDYVDMAYRTSAAESQAQPAGHAYRACDILSTRPRAGDLICFTREGAADIDNFSSLGQTLARRREQPATAGFPMHCELVVAADRKGDAKLESMGGNVVQSVTLRRMTLNADKTLSRRYIASAQPRPCSTSASCDRNLSFKAWAVLLQFR